MSTSLSFFAHVLFERIYKICFIPFKGNVKKVLPKTEGSPEEKQPDWIFFEKVIRKVKHTCRYDYADGAKNLNG